MRKLIKLEEAGQFLLSILLFSQLHYAWWVFPLFILLPDLSMLGYLFGTKTGAFFYNLFHHKFVAILVMAVGFWLGSQLLMLAGILLFGHSAMDRVLGYGLKYSDDFKHTHLGWIGKKEQVDAV
ncbi:MAG: DUF4260 domain-containing protein [Chitinophagaceae bacterium]